MLTVNQHPIDQAAIDFVQTLISPDFQVRVVCCRRDLTTMPPAYYSTRTVEVRGYVYCFWLRDGSGQLLIHVQGFGVFGAVYRDEWPLILAMGLDQSFSLAA